MAEGKLISEKDERRLGPMLTWWEKHGKTLMGNQHRRRAASIGGGGAGAWFKLSSVASSPMTGRRQTCTDGAFSESVDTDISIYPHPQLTIANYAADDYVFAVYIGNCWVAVCGAGGGAVYTGGAGISISGSNVISSDLDTC